MTEFTRILNQYPIFECLPDDVLAAMAEHVELRTFPEGYLLFSKDDPLDALYIIQQGEVAIFLPQPDGTEQHLADVGPGEALGQMNLVDGNPRTASARSITPVDMLVLSYEDFSAELRHVPDDVIEKMRDVSGEMRLAYADILKDLPVFNGWPDAAVQVLVNSLERVTLEEGDILFEEGDPGNALYIVDHGLVKIVTEDDDGQEVFLNQLGPGEALGEMSLIDQEPRAATVIAAEHSVLLKLAGENFLEAIHDYPTVARDIMRLMSHRLRFTNVYLQQIIDLSTKIAEGDYHIAMNQIRNSRASVTSETTADQARIDALLQAFDELVEGVREREETLKSQVRELTIQIDEQKRKEEFDTITDTDFFAELKETARKLREEADEDDY